jgi:hypothetical protein
MELLPPIASVTLPALALLLLTLLVLRWRQRQGAGKPGPRRGRDARAHADALDTVADWEPEAARVLSITERQAQELLKRAMPGFLVLAQVPLSRFIRVPSRHPYAEWLQRVGALSADLLLCDSGSRVLAVVDIRAAQETERSRRRHERMARVLRAAGIQVHTWREGELPALAEVRLAMSRLVSPAAAGLQTTASRPMPLIPVADAAEIDHLLSAGDRAALEAGESRLEPVASAFFDDLEASPSARG